jgi:dipeptidyl-peptidase-4
MNHHFRSGLFICLIIFVQLFAVLHTSAQKKKISIEETVFAGSIMPANLRNITPVQGDGVFYHTPIVKGKEYLVKGNFVTAKYDTIGATETLFQGVKNIAQILIRSDARWMVLGGGKVLLFDPNTARSELIMQLDQEGENHDYEPSRLQVAYTKGHNLYIQTADGTTTITNETDPGIVSGKAAHRSEYGITKGTFWSPKGNLLAFYRMDERMVTDYPFVDISSVPAAHKPSKYPMAGQKSHQVTLGVYDLSTKKCTYIKPEGDPEQYLTNITWSPDEQEVYIAVLNRATNHMKLNSYNAKTGDFVKTLFEEKHDKYVEPENGPFFLPGKSTFVWQSERNGYNHLYLYNLNGKLIRQLTEGNKVVTRIYGTDTKAEHLYVQIAEDNGMNYRIYKVGIANKSMTALTPEPGEHTAIMHPSGQQLIISMQSPNVPRSIYAINHTGKKLSQIFTAPNPLAAYEVPSIEAVSLTAVNGMALNGRIIKPANFDPAKKYPVIIYVYGGPHAQMIKNSWCMAASPLLLYWAQEGFLVFTVDNRGSANRGLSFEQETYRRLGTPELEDQLTGVQYLKQLPYVDADRIGVHGWSFGGFMTTTMLCKAADVFKVGIAGAPVIDWKMYEIMYTERYMDTPTENPAGYETANLLNYAKDVKGRLMLIHGTSDDVVVWQHTIAFLQKAIQSGVDVDYFIYPGHGHGVGGRDRLHLHKKMTRYFKEYL